MVQKCENAPRSNCVTFLCPLMYSSSFFYNRCLCTECCAADVGRKAAKRPRPSDNSSEDEDVDDDDDDDDMDDFIDDGSDVERTDYSHYIRELFGYDRRKLVILFVFRKKFDCR